MRVWSTNGQIIRSDVPIVFKTKSCTAFAMVPEEDSLNLKFANKYVKRELTILKQIGLRLHLVKILGEEAELSSIDSCKSPTWLIMWPRYLEPPLRCGDHFLPIPLYRLSPSNNDEIYYDDICFWHEAYRAFHYIWTYGTGERYAYRQLSSLNSKLTKEGLKVRERIESLTRTPTYYFLDRIYGRSLKQEKARRCPSCGGAWIQEEPIHGRFHFKCEKCRLLSTTADWFS